MKPKPKAAKKKPPVLRRTAGFRLVLIDENPIRKAALAAYHRVEKQIGRARAQIEEFENGDRPAYERWEACSLGPLLTELRETLLALQEKGRLLQAIDQEIFWTGCSEVTAYRRVMHAEKNPSLDDEEAEEEDKDFGEGEGERIFGENIFPPDFDVHQFDRSSPRKQAEFRNFYDTMAALFEDLTGMEAMDFEEALRQERERRGGARKAKSERAGAESSDYESRNASRPPKGAASAPRETSRLKELYRILVRRLHPDHNHKQTPTERELWHQVQEAYRTGNVEALESISGRLDVGLNGNSNHLPVQIILRMARDLRSALRSLQRLLTETRQHPAWAFRSKASGLPAFEAKRRKEIARQQRDASRNLADATAVLADLAARAAKPERARRTRATPPPSRGKSRGRPDYEQVFFQF